jgi:hypothetical protein
VAHIRSVVARSVPVQDRRDDPNQDHAMTHPTEIERRTRASAQAQLDAYNARDIDAFVACFAPDVELFDLRSGASRGQGRAQMRRDYGALFARATTLCARVTHRGVVGNVAFDREVVTGLRDEPVHAMAIYEVADDGLITRVWFVIE